MIHILHLGCGGVFLKDAINVDIKVRDFKNDDYIVINDDVITLCKVLNEIMLFEHRIDTIVAYHVIEHLPRPGKQSMRPNVHDALNKWNQFLPIGGNLILECPDFDQTVQEYVNGNMKRKDNIYGLNRNAGDVHSWGYGVNDLAELITKHGFEVVCQGPGTDYHAALEPCQRLEARKTCGLIFEG